MKTLADIKRRMRVGTRLLCIENTYRPKLNGSKRTVVRAGATVFYWDDDRGAQGSVMHYPTSRDVSILDADTFQLRLFPERDEYVRLRFLLED